MSSSPNPSPASKKLTFKQLLSSLRNLETMQTEQEVEVVELAPGQVLFEQGDEGDALYVLFAGMLGVRVRQADGSDVEIDRLSPGAIVGEMALVGGEKRSATVYAVNDVGLFRLDRAEYERMLAEDPSATATITGQFDTRFQRLQLVEVFQNLLGELDSDTLALLQQELSWLHLSNGDLLFEQGDPNDGLYVVINGRLRVTTQFADGRDEVVAEIPSGETVGEYAFLSNETRVGTVRAVRETNVVQISPETFQRLGQKSPELVARIASIVISRRQRSLQNGPMISDTLAIAVLPAGPHIDTNSFCQQLAATMTPYGTVGHLSAHSFETEFGHKGAAQVGLEDSLHGATVAWLDEYETNHQYVLFAADATVSNWTKRCINHADRVLILSDGRGDASPSALERYLEELPVSLRQALVLWHPAGTERPQGTARWLEPRTVAAHHHICQGNDAHMERLGRRLTGKAVGLALSGGSARGFAQLGVYQVLEELDVPVDYIGCTSMGAVMGAGFAAFGSSATVTELAGQFADPKVIFDRTLPFTSIMESRKVTNLMKGVFGDRLIEDEWIPFFCVATNLTTAEAVVIERGPLWRAVRSSLAIPGVFTPVMENGDTIVDGGIMDNFPVRLLANRCESTRIVGVNVMPFKDKKRDYDFDTNVSGWKILFSRLNPFRKALWTPSIVGILLRTMEINSVNLARQEEAFATVVIEPDTSGIRPTEYHRYKELAQRGYDAAKKPLTGWWAEEMKRFGC